MMFFLYCYTVIITLIASVIFMRDQYELSLHAYKWGELVRVAAESFEVKAR